MSGVCCRERRGSSDYIEMFGLALIVVICSAGAAAGGGDTDALNPSRLDLRVGRITHVEKVIYASQDCL